MTKHWKTYLNVLGLPEYYIPEKSLIKSQYRKLALKKHSDHGGSKEEMSLLNEAKSYLYNKYIELKDYFCSEVKVSIEDEFPFLNITSELVQENQELLGEVCYVLGIDNY